MRARYWTLTMAVVLGISATAHAQPAGPQAPPADVHAQAEEQFRQARMAMNEQRYAQAVNLLRASQAAEFGRGKLLNIAVCEEALGQLVLALDHYEMVAAQLPDTDERASVVASKIAALRPRIPTLQILVNGAAPGRSLTIDGQEVPASVFAAGMRLDPGAHSIDIVEAGFHRDVILTERQHEQLNLKVTSVAPFPMPEPDPEPPATAPVPDPAPPRSEPAAGSSLGGSWTPSVGLGVMGLASLGTGTVFGILALSKQNESDASCDVFKGTTYCDPRGADLRASSRSFAPISTLTIALGASLLGMAVWKFVDTARSRSKAARVTTRLAVAPGSVLVVGSW